MAGVCFYDRALISRISNAGDDSTAPTEVAFDVICVTSPQQSHADSYAAELRQRLRDTGRPPCALILAVADPSLREENFGGGGADSVGGAGVGSGGATLNALLVITEHLAALAGETAITPDALRGRRVLLLHVGGGGDRVPLFSELTAAGTAGKGEARADAHGASGTLESVLACVEPLARQCAAGVWVCSAEATAPPTSTAMAKHLRKLLRRL